MPRRYILKFEVEAETAQDAITEVEDLIALEGLGAPVDIREIEETAQDIRTIELLGA